MDSISDESSSDEEFKQTPDKKRKVEVDSSSYSLDAVEKPVAYHTAIKRFIPAPIARRKPPADSVGSKALYVGPLRSSCIKLSDLVNLFKDSARQIDNVWFSLNKYQVFQSHAFVTFTTTEAARMAAVEEYKFRRARFNGFPVSILLDCFPQQIRVQNQMDEIERESFKKKRVSREQSAINESHGPVGGGLESHQVEPKKVKEKHVSRICGVKTIVSFEREFTKIALKFYERQQGAKFKILEVLFSNRAMLAVPGFGLDRLWCHVSFIAKPINADCSACANDDSPKHFFGEMVYNCDTKQYDVNFCSIFEPSDPANIEGCVFCPPNPIFVHPAHGCPAGGREIGKFTLSQAQIGGCSKLHPERPHVIQDEDKNEQKYFGLLESLRYGYAKIALEFFEKEGAEFEIVVVDTVKHSPVFDPESKRITEWCEVRFRARPRNVNGSYVPPLYFTGELLRDVTTGKYNALYCQTYKNAKDTRFGTDGDCRPDLPSRVGVSIKYQNLWNIWWICPIS